MTREERTARVVCPYCAELFSVEPKKGDTHYCPKCKKILAVDVRVVPVLDYIGDVE